MALTSEERDLFEEKFKGVTTLMNAQFINVNDKLDAIHDEAVKTNSRITKLEEYKEFTREVIATRVTPELVKEKIDEVYEEEEKLDERIQKLEEYREEGIKIIATRVTPEEVKEVRGEIKIMEDKMADINFFIKYPKLFIAGMVTIIILTLAVFLESNPLKVFSKEPVKQPVQTEITK